jgi:hypothetical protein
LSVVASFFKAAAHLFSKPWKNRTKPFKGDSANARVRPMWPSG